MFKRLKAGSKDAKDIRTMLAGAGSSSIVPLLLTPILSRLYDTYHFGLLSIFVSIVTILSVFATGRYELAIYLPKEGAQAKRIFLVAVGFLACFVAIAFPICAIGGPTFAAMLNAPDLAPYFFLLPFVVASLSFYNVSRTWFLRRGEFKFLAPIGLFQVLGDRGTSLIIRAVAPFPGALIVAYTVGQTITTSIFAIKLFKHRGSVTLNWPAAKAILSRYRNFPFFTVPSDAVGLFATLLPVFVLNVAFGTGVVGQFNMVTRISSVTSAVISGAVADVFRQRASAEYSATGQCRASWVRTFKRLAMIGGGPVLLLVLFGPSIFSFAFGEKWRMAGELSRVLAPYIYLQYLAGPLSITIILAEKQKLNLIWTVSLCAVTFLGLYIGTSAKNVQLSVAAWSIAYSFMYLWYLKISYDCSGGSSSPKTTPPPAPESLLPTPTGEAP